MAVHHRAVRRFNLLHPFTALIYFAGLLASMFILTDLPRRLIAVVSLLAVAAFFTSLREVSRVLKWLLPLGLLICVINPLFDHHGRTVLFYLWGNSITAEAIVMGVSQALLLTGLILLFTSFNRVIEPSSFLYLTARFMPRTALLLNVSLQTASRLSRRTADMLDVQKTRDEHVPKRRYALLLLNAFTNRSLEEGLEMALTIKARDYRSGRRTHYRKHRFKPRDVFALTLMLALFIFMPNVFILFPLLMEGLAYAGRRV
jgi:energy-coupling factor transport system permease protein